MSTEKFPEAKNMLAMISRNTPVGSSRPRTTFSDVKRNYRYITTTIRDYQPEKSPEVALIEAAHEWWDLHLYNQGFQGVTPQRKDFPNDTMAKAETPRIGCAVDLCPIDHNMKFYVVLCYYAHPNVRAKEPLYQEGLACSNCPDGYKCDDEKKLCKRM
ncbi:hypothetical protein OSTOST_06821 [Ostertagia ostertagi]